MKKVSLKGVIIGSITDILATNLVAIPLVIYAVFSLNNAGIPKDQISSVLKDTLRNDPTLYYSQLVLGALCSILGGYIAARIAKRHELLNGALAAFLCVGLGVYAMLFGSSSQPIWQYLVHFVSNPALSAFGGYLRLRAVQRTI